MCKEQKTYLDAFPKCEGCPVHDFCGTAVGSLRLCRSHQKIINP